MLMRQFEGGLVTDVSTTADVEVGSRRMYKHPTYGWQELLYIRNGEASSSLTAGLAVMLEASVAASVLDGNIAGTSTSNARFLGVAMHTIAAGSYGWILRRGFGLIASNGSTTANTAQKCVASGQFADGTIGTDDLPVFAIAANAIAGSTSLAYVNP